MIAVSACLAGHKCRYDGKCVPDGETARMVRCGEALPICPEVLGGLKTPRDPAEITGGDGNDVLNGVARVVTSCGEDVTEAFVAGAHAALEICAKHGIKRAILKRNSPSCGCGEIYDGSFARRLINGAGVTAALLKRHGITVEAK